MFKEFMYDLIDSGVSFKTVLNEQAMYELSKYPDVVLVHSPVLYRLYALYVGDKDTLEERPAFFRKAGAYLYYERLTCAHGDEFYYYIRFNKASAFYKEHKDFISMLILASDPTTLTDYIGNRRLDGFNKTLKE